ncbi:MAG: metal-dependent hydrolase [Candidatus Margulisiibacteriota bacterium]
MLAPTHSVFGIFLTLTILAVFGVEWGLHWTIILWSILGAIIPDIDHPRSTIGRIFPFISIPLERKYGHRTITHSLIGWLIFTVIFSFLLIVTWLLGFVCNLSLVSWDLAPRWIAAFSISYFSHLLLDMFNPRGSQMLWPEPVRDVIPKSPNFRPASGSKVELFIFFFLLSLMFLALPISKYGLISSLHWLLATPGSAIEESKYLKTHAYVEFKGIMNETRVPVVGRGEILDAKNGRLIILYKDNVCTLSDTLAADILASHVRVKKTAFPIVVERQEFQKANRGDLLSRIPTGALISGVVHLPEGLDIKLPINEGGFQIMEQKGQDLVLTYASKDQIAKLTSSHNFDLQSKLDRAELAKLHAQQRKLQSQIKEIQTDNDLTPLGKKLLMDKKDHYQQDVQLSVLQSQLEEVNIRVEELKSKINDQKLLFSGEVYIRQ